MAVFTFIYPVTPAHLRLINCKFNSLTLFKKEFISGCAREDISVIVLWHWRRQNFPATWEDLSLLTEAEAAGKACWKFSWFSKIP